MGSLRLPAWLRRGLEAGIFAALLSLVTVVTLGWEQQSPGPVVLPGGLGAALVLALPVLSIGVLAVAYPVALAATKGDAILGAITAWVVGADLLAIVTVVTGQRILLLGAGVTVPLGVLAGLVAAPAALAGLLAAQLFTPLGFGRRAGRTAAIASSAVAIPVLLIIVPIAA
jgi:hypothetical protein